MPSLAERQRDFASAVMAGASANGIAPGRVPADAACQIHRNTVIGALVNALRISYPSVDALVGEAFFDQTAMAFAEAHPSTAARLAGYGAGFPDFLAMQVPSLPYLPDVALLDWAVEQTLAMSSATRRFALDANVTLQWPVSLRLLPLRYPADEIKAALGDDTALAAIDITVAPRVLLVWRSGRQALTRIVSAPSAAFVDAMLSGAGAEAALAAAIAQSPEALSAIQVEIFTASFCTIISGEPS